MSSFEDKTVKPGAVKNFILYLARTTQQLSVDAA